MEQRLFIRRKVEALIEGSLVKGFHLLDISQAGALIESTENLKIDSEFLMNFRLNDDSVISIVSRVVRSTLTGCRKKEGAVKKTPVYQIGFRFVNPHKDQLNKLVSAIIEEESKNSSEKIPQK